MLRRPRPQFQTLLRVRKRLEDVRAAALASVRREINLAEQERASIVEQQRRALTQAGQTAGAVFRAHDVRPYYEYERHLAQLAVLKDAKILELQHTESERRGELEEAMKQRRVVERLIERRRQAFLEDVRSAEQSAHDEIGAGRFARARKGGRRP